MPPDEPAVTGAPLRFGERAQVGDSGRGRDDGDEPLGFGGPPGAPVMPAGPPPLRGPAAEPDTTDRDRDRGADEPATSEVDAVDAGDAGDAVDAGEAGDAGDPVAPVERRAAGPPKAPPTDLANLRRRERKQVAKRRARKVKRIVRRFDAWSVLKVAFIFNLCAYIVSMVAGVVLWRVADGAGVIENIESFIEDLGAFETYRFEPDLIFEAYALGGAVLAVLATGLIALAAVLFNLISDLVGGIRLTVIEEPGSLPARRRRSGGKASEDSGTVSGP